ncbi:MAG: hypothetical protein JST00_38230 [Deltaproteobacteria bacterium]|nr:hypothetical protein [Deltaproteobacteria bacterium]
MRTHTIAILIAASTLFTVTSAEAQKPKGKAGKRPPAAAPAAPPPAPAPAPAAPPEPEPPPAPAKVEPTAKTELTSAPVTLATPPSDARGETKPEASPEKDAAQAGAPNDEVAGGEYRSIDGYRFITPIEAYSAFANTSFRFAQGFGVVSFEMPSPLDGTSKPGRLFLYGQQLFGQIGISNRVAFDLRAEGSAGVGGNLDSILGVGALALLNTGVMPKVRLFTVKNPAIQVSVGAGAFYSRTLQIKPSALVGKLTGDVQGAEGQIIQQVGSFSIAPALMAAYAVGPLGLQTSVGPTIGVGGDEKSSGLTAGVHAGFDLYRLTKSVPVAIVGEYGHTSTFGEAGSASNTVGGGLYYSGKRDFELGLISRIKPGDLAFTQAQMVMQYYF